MRYEDVLASIPNNEVIGEIIQYLCGFARSKMLSDIKMTLFGFELSKKVKPR